MNKIAILPTLLTLGNAVCGFAAISLAAKIDPRVLEVSEINQLFFAVGGLILLAMVFDALDGFAARLTKSASDFGGQLDSLCDAISFGAAPAFLLLKLTQEWDKPMVKKAIAVIATLYMVCAVLRLARFNTETTPDPASHKRFKGLPSPAAAGCVAAVALLRSELPFYSAWTGIDDMLLSRCLLVFAPIGTLLVALLMVSRLSYPHIVNQMLRRRRNFSVVVQVVLAISFFVIVQDLAPFLLFWGYALYGPFRYAWRAALPAPTAQTPADVTPH